MKKNLSSLYLAMGREQMPKYVVSATEINTYSMVVEANSEESARAMVEAMFDPQWIHIDHDFTIGEIVISG